MSKPQFLPVTLCPSTGKTTQMTHILGQWQGSPTVSLYMEADMLQGHKRFLPLGGFFSMFSSLCHSRSLFLSNLINGGAYDQNSYFLSAKFNSTQLIYRKQQASLNANICLNHSPRQQRCAWQLMGCFCFGCMTAGCLTLCTAPKECKLIQKHLHRGVQHAVCLRGPTQTFIMSGLWGNVFTLIL